jgi:hypothetical protein
LLVRQAVAWHQLGSGDRIILVVTPDNEAAGAERFYQRLGWQVLVRQRKGWRWEDHLVAKAPEIV